MNLINLLRKVFWFSSVIFFLSTFWDGTKAFAVKRPTEDFLSSPSQKFSKFDYPEEDDPNFLADVQKIETDYLSKQEETKSPHEKNLQKDKDDPSPLPLNPIFVDDTFFSSPAFLNDLHKVELKNAQQKILPTHPKASDLISVKVLSRFPEHQAHLLSSIKNAKKSILITSHAFSPKISPFQEKLFLALNAASLRNVRIYLYFNKDYGVHDKDIFSLEKTGVRLDSIFVHSKLLVIDHNLITCGSFDWLSGSEYTQSHKDASIVLSYKDLNPFIQDIWSVLKKYKQITLNPYALYWTERNFDLFLSQTLKEDVTNEEYELLTTPQQHHDFFIECLETTQHKMTFCAPFITKIPEYLENIFPRPLVDSFLKRGKTLEIFYRANDEAICFLVQHLFPFKNYSNLLLLPAEDLHRKTLIKDTLYAEGSFNWLSSARTLQDDYFLMETSLIVKGSKAEAFIEDFYRLIK